MGRNKKKSQPLVQSTPTPSSSDADERISATASDSEREAPPAKAVTIADPADLKKPKHMSKAAIAALAKKEQQMKKSGGGKKGAAPDEKPKDKAIAVAPSESDDDSSDDEEHGPVVVTKQVPVVVTYCEVCTFPPEFCVFSGMFEKCKPWLMEHLGEEEAAALEEATEKGRKRKGPGGKKVKFCGEEEIVFEVRKRSGRRMLTTVKGMEHFGVVLDKNLVNEWRKLFSCGVGIIESPGAPTAVEVQGDVSEKLAEMLQTPKYGAVPQAKMFRVREKKRAPFFEE